MVYFACRTAATTRRMLLVVAAVSLAVAVLTVALMVDLGFSRAAAEPAAPRDLAGTVVVPFGASADPVSCGLSVDEALAVLGGDSTEPCPGGPLGGWTDVAAGTEVVLTDGAGVLLGTTPLTGGVAQGGTVTFDFALDDVPGADAYVFAVNARGEVVRTADQLARDGWKVVLDLR